MIGKKTEDSHSVTLPEVKALLEARASQPDFGYEQQTSLDYSKKFAKLEKGDADKLLAALMEIDGMKMEAAVKLVDIMPMFKSQLVPILAKDKVLLSDSAQAKVLDAIKSAKRL
jgi:DNA-directed RNA polymerase subunit F